MCERVREQHNPRSVASEQAMFFQFLPIALRTLEDSMKNKFTKLSRILFAQIALHASNQKHNKEIYI